jgi:hypothetical protein
MPHNRTRMWVGLAIVAVTIPAVGQYLYRPGTNDNRAQAYLQQARWNATNSVGLTTVTGLRLARSPRNRDYLAEVNAAIGRQGTVFAGGQAYSYDNGPDYPYDSGPANGYPAADYRDVQDEMFDINPLDGPVYTDDRLPDPATLVAPDSDEVAPISDEGVADDEGPADDGQAIANDEDPYTDGLSDGAVYATVVNNLPPNDRQEFVRAWAAMTPDQRADLLDGFREKLDGNNP